MAMTKAEREELERLRTMLALRFPNNPMPERTVKAVSWTESVTGWDYNLHSGIVDQWWTKSGQHGAIHQGRHMTGSQHSRDLYATKLEATLALQWALALKCAKEMRALELRMEALTREQLQA